MKIDCALSLCQIMHVFASHLYFIVLKLLFLEFINMWLERSGRG